GPARSAGADRGVGWSLGLWDGIAGRRGDRAAATHCTPETCMIDADFLTEVGFEVVAPHHRFPRLRLELDSDHGWKEDVERALDQLLAAASMEPPTRVGAH
ncbi:hypothetical protein ACFWPJ_10745, partial [Nocardia sp. NPDC058497]